MVVMALGGKKVFGQFYSIFFYLDIDQSKPTIRIEEEWGNKKHRPFYF